MQYVDPRYVQYTEPTLSYWNICKMIEALLHHCEKHNITIWAEFGTLIGLKRHGQSIIPWDYDGDFGIFLENKERFLETFAQEKPSDIVLDIGYYNDTGCMALRVDGNDVDIVDIIFYENKENVIDSMQNDTTKKDYPSNDGYCYFKEDFYPLTKTLMLGHLVYCPNKWEKILAVHYENWTEYPIQFQNYILPKFLASPFKEIECITVENFDQLRKLVETKNTPFIIKKTNFLDCSLEQFEKLINNQQNNIFGYGSSITWNVQESNAKTVWDKFLSKNLEFNIVDSPTDDKSIVPLDWNTYVENKLGEKYNYALTWIMTNKPKITHFHIDPDYAGGYMKLLEGEKIWWCIAPNDYHYLLDKGHSVSTLAELEIHKLMQLEKSYLFGKIHIDTITDGDLLWFPIDTLHKVITTRDSYGFGGYL